MKKIITFLMLFSISSYSQDRINKSLPVLGKQLGILDNAIGWQLSPEGQWISRKNKIPYSIENQFASLIDHNEYGLGNERENFMVWKIREIRIDNLDYIIFSRKYRDGFYEYASIQEGWSPYNSFEFFIMKLEELDKISITPDILGNISLKILFYEDIKYISSNFNDLDLQKAIRKTVDHGSMYKNDTLYLNILPISKNKKIRFYFSVNSRDLVNEYYETDIANFKMLINKI